MLNGSLTLDCYYYRCGRDERRLLGAQWGGMKDCNGNARMRKGKFMVTSRTFNCWNIFPALFKAKTKTRLSKSPFLPPRMNFLSCNEMKMLFMRSTFIRCCSFFFLLSEEIYRALPIPLLSLQRHFQFNRDFINHLFSLLLTYFLTFLCVYIYELTAVKCERQKDVLQIILCAHK